MEQPSKPEDAAKPLILVVDDLADNRDLYAAYFEYVGYQVETAADGHEALAKAFELHPDAVLMDLSLPGVDGWEVTRRIRQNPSTSEILVIGLSGHSHYAADAKVSGCDAFLAKPCLPEKVAEEIRRALAKTKTSFKLP